LKIHLPINSKVSVSRFLKNLALITFIFSIPFLCNSVSARGIPTETLFNNLQINIVHFQYSIGVVYWLGIVALFSFGLFYYIVKTEQSSTSKAVVESDSLGSKGTAVQTRHHSTLKVVQPTNVSKVFYRRQYKSRLWLAPLNALQLMKSTEGKQPNAAS